MFGGRKIMQSSLKKSLYLGLAALSFAGVAAVSTTASAKSYATAGAYTTLKTDATKRNVEATGTNALYTKPGTVKGAKVVASKATMATLASSKKSADYFRAYGVKTTNRGSVYYRVVSMDGKYRGYVYGGNSDTAFAGGIKSADTTTTATTPTRTTGYYLKDVSKNTLWTAPKNTQYKASKVSLYGVKSTDTFKVDSAATKTREGSLYYHVTDTQNTSVSGWIYAGKGYVAGATTQDLGGLSLTMSDAAATSDNSVKVVYRASGSQVGTATWVTSAAGTKAGATVGTTATNAAGVKLADFVTNSLPSGYTTTGTVDTASATYGNTVYVDVTAAATSKVQLVADNVDNTASTTDNAVAGVLAKGAKLSSSDLSATLSADGVKALTGTKGETIGDTNLATISSAFGTAAINGSKTYYAANGDAYHYVFTYEPANFANDNRLATYGDTLTASFKAVLTKGAPSASSSDSSWIA
ncbi:pore-forming S-layer protein SlpA [Levilactobacillus brevis]|uniref:Pore-forming S-layer protein SlpA n=1 Tax=Levilactobacillus brevis TaxID=1580 RepID=A0AB38X3Y4_LEVBR|nr:pore-forming S-layer protein SlpA [Levilactobacillus brevis]WAD01242.1 pore-forming S-layer protein SlpA [Levilactobacillus brevis]